MCKFFSLLSDGHGKITYFDAKLRRAIKAGEIKDNAGNPITQPDSHSSIAAYYGLDEDKHNKWEYNPYTDVLEKDSMPVKDDTTCVHDALNALDWRGIAGDVAAVRELLAALRANKWMDGHGVLPDGVKMYDTWDDAWDAAQGSEWDEATRASWDAALKVAQNAARDAARDILMDIAKDASQAPVMRAIWDAGQLLRCLSIVDLLPQEHLAHARKRMDVWFAGYGVAGDVNGVLYCYRRA